jgi:hypothetical protein
LNYGTCFNMQMCGYADMQIIEVQKCKLCGNNPTDFYSICTYAYLHIKKII